MLSLVDAPTSRNQDSNEDPETTLTFLRVIVDTIRDGCFFIIDLRIMQQKLENWSMNIWKMIVFLQKV